MFSMFGEVDWNIEEAVNAIEKANIEDKIHVGDIVLIATRDKNPVFKSTSDYNDEAKLRVLGEVGDEYKQYLCLVTSGDAEHIMPTTVVNKTISREYEVESRFYGYDAIVVSELHVRKIAKKQRGCFCLKCMEYNEHMDHNNQANYLCSTCKTNPWR